MKTGIANKNSSFFNACSLTSVFHYFFYDIKLYINNNMHLLHEINIKFIAFKFKLNIDLRA